EDHRQRLSLERSLLVLPRLHPVGDVEQARDLVAGKVRDLEKVAFHLSGEGRGAKRSRSERKARATSNRLSRATSNRLLASAGQRGLGWLSRAPASERSLARAKASQLWQHSRGQAVCKNRPMSSSSTG